MYVVRGSGFVTIFQITSTFLRQLLCSATSPPQSARDWYKKARAQEICNLTEDYFDVFVPHHQPKVFALANTGSSGAIECSFLLHTPFRWASQSSLKRYGEPIKSFFCNWFSPIAPRSIQGQHHCYWLPWRLRNVRKHCTSIFWQHHIWLCMTSHIVHIVYHYLKSIFPNHWKRSFTRTRTMLVKTIISSEERTIRISAYPSKLFLLISSFKKLVHWLCFILLFIYSSSYYKKSTAVHETTHNLVPFTTRGSTH